MESDPSTDKLAEVAGIKGRFPVTLEEADKVEDLLAGQLEKLSLVERDKILFDVHGIAQEVEETPEMIEENLKKLDEALSKMRKKPAFDLARYLDAKYVDDPAFRIMFLRSESFDIKKTAKKLVAHFEMKRELFGDGEILAREIRMSDLSEDDMVTLKSGFLQILPTRDAAGRSIFCLCPAQKKYKTIENLTRTMWYVMTSSLRDDETQKKGAVMIVCNIGEKTSREKLSIMIKLQGIRMKIPKRVVGAHFCFDDALLRPFISGIKLYLGDNTMRSRFRPHYGTYEDIKFELQTYGIPMEDHPLEENGSLCLKWHLEWIQIRQAQEASVSMKDGVIVPRRFDVLFGRGKNTREHTGNLRAVHLVEMHREKYEQANKYEKTEISERIVSIIHESHGRFLRWEADKGWVEVEHEAAREKISHFFRHMRHVKKTTTTTTTTPVEQPTPKRIISPCASPVHPIDCDGEKDSKQIRSN